MSPTWDADNSSKKDNIGDFPVLGNDDASVLENDDQYTINMTNE